MKTITEIAGEVTADLLRKMSAGFWYNGRYRHDPLPWDANNGYCEDWAEEVARRYNEENDLDPDHPEAGCAVWHDDEDQPEHCYVVLSGRFYDAEHPDGVDVPEDLSIFGDNPRPEP